MEDVQNVLQVKMHLCEPVFSSISSTTFSVRITIYLQNFVMIVLLIVRNVI